MSRHLRKPLDLTLKVIAVALGMFILSMNDFDLNSLKTIITAVFVEAVLILILNRYGR